MPPFVPMPAPAFRPVQSYLPGGGTGAPATPGLTGGLFPAGVGGMPQMIMLGQQPPAVPAQANPRARLAQAMAMPAGSFYSTGGWQPAGSNVGSIRSFPRAGDGGRGR